MFIKINLNNYYKNMKNMNILLNMNKKYKKNKKIKKYLFLL